MDFWPENLGEKLFESIAFEIGGRVVDYYGVCKCHCGCKKRHHVIGPWESGELPDYARRCNGCSVYCDEVSYAVSNTTRKKKEKRARQKQRRREQKNSEFTGTFLGKSSAWSKLAGVVDCELDSTTTPQAPNQV